MMGVTKIIADIVSDDPKAIRKPDGPGVNTAFVKTAHQFLHGPRAGGIFVAPEYKRAVEVRRQIPQQKPKPRQ
jgi:hypothetical protein